MKAPMATPRWGWLPGSLGVGEGAVWKGLQGEADGWARSADSTQLCHLQKTFGAWSRYDWPPVKLRFRPCQHS